MFKGTVTFSARIKGNGLKFPLLEFDPKEVGVDKVEVEGPNGDKILSTVHLASVATQEDGNAIATKVNEDSFSHGVAIENGQSTSAQFSPLSPQAAARLVPATGNHAFTGYPANLVVGITAATLKAELEQSSPPGGQHFGLFRSARQSMSPVEEFMHLYHILLMLFEDSQGHVDDFIRRKDPAVSQTQDPRKGPGVMETVYTRLRNEFGHRRSGVNVDATKAEMANRLGELVKLTKRAIEERRQP